MPRPDVPLPVIGDRIVHPAFGPCVVEKMEDDEDFVMVRSATRRLLRLSLDMLELELVDSLGGHRTFEARVLRPAKGRS